MLKKSTRFVVVVVLLCFNFSYSQVTNNSHPKDAIKYAQNVNEPLTDKELGHIKEVYGDHVKSQVLENKQYLKDLKHLLRNRLEIFQIIDPSKQKKCKLLSEVSLFDEFNKNLKRDDEFNLKTFNPLKYNMQFFGKGTYLYRIDNTNYFIQITSQYRQ